MKGFDRACFAVLFCASESVFVFCRRMLLSLYRDGEKINKKRFGGVFCALAFWRHIFFVHEKYRLR